MSFIQINTTDYPSTFTIITNDLATQTGFIEAHTPFSDIVDVALTTNSECVKIIRKSQTDLLAIVPSAYIEGMQYAIVESVDDVPMTSNRQLMETILNKKHGI